MNDYCRQSAASQQLANCSSCSLVSPIELEKCPRCQTQLHLRKPLNLQLTMAYLITALLLYIPANLWPMMVTEKLGQVEYNTIVGGIIVLWQEGSEPIAIVVFVASVLVPIIKFIILFMLCFSVYFSGLLCPVKRLKLYRLTELIGRWSMVDIFVVAILVALIQLDHLLNVQPGSGTIAFAGVVVLTMIAAKSFDPRVLWDDFDRKCDR
ncbi:paraquat-inducible protein A [Psychrobium sp. nBUS_13]|uniref:paraquat-inducible protein A n=1 Tax=Psychrobium sp. nBUS_13 TaxID=3395319 RepID=UPI003EC0A302